MKLNRINQDLTALDPAEHVRVAAKVAAAAARLAEDAAKRLP